MSDNPRIYRTFKRSCTGWSYPDRLPGDPGLPPGVSQKDTEGTETETTAEERQRLAEERADMEED